jgi:sugar fermentation stimulation protein A
MAISIGKALVEAIFLERRNRFVGVVDIEGEQQPVHVLNTGRMKELLVTGARVLLRRADDPLRKTQYTLYMVEKEGLWVALDSTAANVLISQALQSVELADFGEYQTVRREVTYGCSRFDVALFGPAVTCYIEVKSCTLVVDGVARFPDAPTERGRKHVEELITAVQAGHEGAIIFVVQRSDATAFHPNDETDPAFGKAVRKACQAGVKVLAYKCRVTPEKIELAEAIPVDLSIGYT